MAYAEGEGWTIEIVRHPLSGGFQVCVEEMVGPQRNVKRTRVVGNALGYARRAAAERHAEREAERLHDRA